MYKQNKHQPTSIKRNTSYQGETIEHKIDRIINNREPITDGAPLIYEEREEGVKPEHNIRTDRFDLAIDAMTVVTKTELAKRKKRIDDRLEAKKTPEQRAAEAAAREKESGGAASAQGTDNK